MAKEVIYNIDLSACPLDVSRYYVDEIEQWCLTDLLCKQNPEVKEYIDTHGQRNLTFSKPRSISTSKPTSNDQVIPNTEITATYQGEDESSTKSWTFTYQRIDLSLLFNFYVAKGLNEVNEVSNYRNATHPDPEDSFHYDTFGKDLFKCLFKNYHPLFPSTEAMLEKVGYESFQEYFESLDLEDYGYLNIKVLLEHRGKDPDFYRHDKDQLSEADVTGIKLFAGSTLIEGQEIESSEKSHFVESGNEWLGFYSDIDISNPKYKVKLADDSLIFTGIVELNSAIVKNVYRPRA